MLPLNAFWPDTVTESESSTVFRTALRCSQPTVVPLGVTVT